VLDSRGALAGTYVETASLTLNRRGASGPPSQPPRPLPNARWSDLVLNGYGLSRDSLGPGETLRVALYWTADAPLEADRQMSLELTDVTGTVRAAWHGPLVGGHPAASWPGGESIRNWYDLVVPAEAPAGAYNLRLRLDPPVGSIVDLGTIRLGGRPRSFTLPDIQHPLRAQISAFGELMGYALDRDSVRAGQSLRLTLYWRVLATPPASYTVFAHLLDADSRLWGQRDSQPQNGDAPTTSWITGEIISDAYSIPVQADAPPGEYDIEIGMYSQLSGARLPLTNDTGQAIGDYLILGRVAVVQ
jgi:hypothetical protein